MARHALPSHSEYCWPTVDWTSRAKSVWVMTADVSAQRANNFYSRREMRQLCGWKWLLPVLLGGGAGSDSLAGIRKVKSTLAGARKRQFFEAIFIWSGFATPYPKTKVASVLRRFHLLS
jgi:hypothetical protein